MAASATLAFNPTLLLLPYPLYVLLPRHRRFLGAGLHLSHLSRFRGPAHLADVGEGETAPTSGGTAPPLTIIVGTHDNGYSMSI